MQVLHKGLESDLFILCTLTTSKTKLSSFQPWWIVRLQSWWDSVSKPLNLSEAARRLCEDYGLAYHPQQNYDTAQSMPSLPSNAASSERELVIETFPRTYQPNNGHTGDALDNPLQRTIGI